MNNYTITENLITFYTNKYINKNSVYNIIKDLDNIDNYKIDCVYIKKLKNFNYNITISVKNKHKFEYIINNIKYLYLNSKNDIYSADIIRYKFYLDLLKNSKIDKIKRIIESRTHILNFNHLTYNDITKSDESFLFYKYNSHNYKYILKELIKSVYNIYITDIKYSTTDSEFIIFAIYSS